MPEPSSVFILAHMQSGRFYLKAKAPVQTVIESFTKNMKISVCCLPGEHRQMEW